MKNSDFKETAEKYRNEMMRLYGGNTTNIQKENIILSEKVQPADIMPEPENNNDNVNVSDDQPLEREMNIEERFPPPILPDFIRNIQNNNSDTSYGYLKVSVKTGNGGIPIADAFVTVSEIKNGNEHAVRLMLTDSSGSTESIRLPAPPKPTGNLPQDYEQFSKYNISVYSKGYFREASVDVPIFEGITSIQNFYLIPEPFNYSSGERTIVSRNTEPVI